MKALTRKFYSRDTIEVAKDLLGKTLVFGEKKGKITEVEAYLGTKDPASHAFGKPLERKKIFVSLPGISYVFLIYGMHWCFNILAGAKGKMGCVLIQGINDVFGPGRVTKYFGIDGSHSGFDLIQGPIIVTNGSGNFTIEATPRIGITKAIDWPLRFVLIDKGVSG